MAQAQILIETAGRLANVRKARPTITDVGKEAGVSQTAASYVLSGSPYAEQLKPETRRRVVEAARRLGYNRNAAGAALKRGYSDTIVLLIVNWNLAADYAHTTVALTRAAADRGLTFNVFVAADDAEAMRLVTNIPSANPYGLVIVWDSANIPEHALARIHQDGLPVIDLLPPKIEGIASVTPDRAQGWCLATKHLLDLGHRNIGFILDTVMRSRTSTEKLEGYKRALAEARIPFREDLLEEVTSWGLQGGYEGFSNLVSRHPEVTGVISINDPMSLGAIRAAQDMGIVVPDDISVVSGGMTEEGQFFRPRLTTVVHTDSLEAFATRILEALIRIRTNPDAEHPSIFVDMKLMVGESSAPVSKKRSG